jgi:hypothetical protein
MFGRNYRRSDKQRIAEAFHLGQFPGDSFSHQGLQRRPTTFQPVFRHTP